MRKFDNVIAGSKHSASSKMRSRQFRVKNWAEGTLQGPDRRTRALALDLPLAARRRRRTRPTAAKASSTTTRSPSANRPSTSRLRSSSTTRSRASITPTRMGVIHKLDHRRGTQEVRRSSRCSAKALKGRFADRIQPVDPRGKPLPAAVHDVQVCDGRLRTLGRDRDRTQDRSSSRSTATSRTKKCSAALPRSDLPQQGVQGVEGQLEAICQNKSDFKTRRARHAERRSGDAHRPQEHRRHDRQRRQIRKSKITLNQVYFTEYSRPIKIKDLVYQTVKFRGTYKLADSAMISILLTNTVSGSYA